MDSNHRKYDHVASFARIDEILAQPASNFEEKASLPDRDSLTYTNGFYAYCTALFVDIRDSSDLPRRYKRPALARLYRAFISEMVAIMNGHEKSREINIVGDCVWGVFNTPKKDDLRQVFSLAAKANTLIKVLNYKLKARGYNTPIEIGIGMSYGRALMIKAGASRSGIADVVYMGDVVNKASKLAAKGSSETWQPIVMDGVFHQHLDDHRKSLTEFDDDIDAWVSSAISTAMNDWYKSNCK